MGCCTLWTGSAFCLHDSVDIVPFASRHLNHQLGSDRCSSMLCAQTTSGPIFESAVLDAADRTPKASKDDDLANS